MDSIADHLKPGFEGAESEDCFFISGNRHDRDRVEVQFGFDGLVRQQSGKFMYDVDFALFVPKSLGLLETEDASNLRQDFQSYVRLHTHSSDPNSETSLIRVRDRLQQLRQNPDGDNARILAIEFEGFVKASSKRVRKEIEAIEARPELVKLVEDQIGHIASLVRGFRDILKEQGLEEKVAPDTPNGSWQHELLLLSEYISHIFVQFLVTSEFAARSHKKCEDLSKILRELETEESQFRQAHKLLIEQRYGPQSSDEEDLYLRRIGLLKKYFHKPLFVHVSGESLQKRLLIPVYGLSAALAASWAIMIQLYQAQSIMDRVGINSIALITMGILAYVLKDIMKDFFRKYFFKTSSKWFPDFEKKLYIHRREKKHKIGVIKEYLRVFDSESLPADLKEARYSCEGGEIEQFLHEDVLHFKKRVVLDLSHLDTKREFPWGLREILRYRFDRLMPSMEDAFKNLYVLSKNGMGAARQGHRIYHIYMAAWINRHDSAWSWREHPSTKPEFKSYRITLDKSGVLACESARWKRKFGIPSRPS